MERKNVKDSKKIEIEERLLSEDKHLIDVWSGTSITNKKCQIYVTFICGKHSEFGEQTCAWNDFNRLGECCSYCSNRNMKQTARKELYELNPNVTMLSDYKGWDDKIDFKCNICGHEWATVFRVFRQGGGCPKCAKKRAIEKTQYTTEQFSKLLYDRNPDIEVIGEYKGSHEFIRCRCKIHDIEWESYACNLLNRTALCPMCSLEEFQKKMFFTKEELDEIVYNRFNNQISIIGEYKGRDNLIECCCHNHEEDYCYTTLAKNILYGGGGCSLCNQSRGERLMVDYLKELGFDITSQKTFSDCKHINLLRFDAYDEKNRVAWEFHGLQHYEPIDFFGGVSAFEDGKIRDDIKVQYCKDNGIKLIVIPYWDIDNIKKIIEENI